MTLSDRIAVMDQGRLVQVATPGEIYEQPNSRYVADFIGDINILEGQVAGRQTGPAGGLVEIGLPSGARLGVESPETVETGQTVWLAVRPEKMRIALEDAQTSAGLNTLAGTVFDIGYLGDWTNYRVNLDTGQQLRVAMPNVTRFNDRPITWEDRVALSFAPQAGVLLTR